MMSYSTLNKSLLVSPSTGHGTMDPGTKPIILSTSLVIIQILAVFGNTMLFLVVYAKPHLRTRTNMFILNLACADLGVAVLCMPFSVITCARQSWVFGSFLSQFNAFANILFTMCSLLTLTAISVEKYFTIVKPLNRVMTRRRTALLLVVTWVEPVIFALLPLTGITRYQYKKGSTQCSVQNPVSLGQIIHAGLVFLIAYVIPLSIIALAYINIFKTVRVHNRRMIHTTMKTVTSTRISSQNQIALSIFIMLIVFIICWTPYFVYIAYITIGHAAEDQSRDLSLTAYWCGFFNSALNPFIYGIRNPHFKAAYKDMLLSASHTICSSLCIAKKRGYSNSSTTISKPSKPVIPSSSVIALDLLQSRVTRDTLKQLS